MLARRLLLAFASLLAAAAPASAADVRVATGTQAEIQSTVDAFRAGAEVQATRGARICTWREAERVLAGFPDDRADEGPAAGGPSLVGLRIARERGWTAPQRPAADRGGAGTTRSDPASSTAGAADDTAPTRRAVAETRVDEASEPGTPGTPKEADK